MVRIIYLIILGYFLLGGIGFYLINRKKKPEEARKNRVKFAAYFIIIHILFFSIVVYPLIFRFVAVIVIFGGLYELFKLFRSSRYRRKQFFVATLVLYAFFAAGFYFFSGLQKELILFSFLILSIFDSFSQISGQLWGKKNIFPKISPNKTVEGFIGGAAVAVLSAVLLRRLVSVPPFEAVTLAIGIIVFAFLGDILASFYKRVYQVKDFSNLIPGHGGILDRFDSLLAGGAGVAVFSFVWEWTQCL